MTQAHWAGVAARSRLPSMARQDHLPPMFVLTESDAAAIRTAYERDGEFSAATELRGLFPGIADNARARECARSIAGWRPTPAPGSKVTRCILTRIGLSARRQDLPEVRTAKR